MVFQQSLYQQEPSPIHSPLHYSLYEEKIEFIRGQRYIQYIAVMVRGNVIPTTIIDHN